MALGERGGRVPACLVRDRAARDAHLVAGDVPRAAGGTGGRRELHAGSVS